MHGLLHVREEMGRCILIPLLKPSNWYLDRLAAARRQPSASAVERRPIYPRPRRLPAMSSVDVVVSNSTLDHFDAKREIEESLHKGARVSKPGRTLLVSLAHDAGKYRHFAATRFREWRFLR